MFELMSVGIILGLSAGLSPGPLLTLVIAETLQHDIRSGVRVALSPVFTDLPIIVLTFTILTQISGFNSILGIISMIGGGMILYMGYESMHPRMPDHEVPEQQSRSLAKGILVNALSPHPYLFWIGVGGPILSKALNLGFAAPFAFIVSFYIFLLGSKIMLAVLVGRSRSFLSGTVYIYVMRGLGIILWVLAFMLFRDGLQLIDVIAP